MADRNILQEILSAVGEMGKDAAADVGNTYQSVLVQDTGWNLPSTMSDMTWQTAIEVAKDDLQQRQEIIHDNTLDLGYC